jgi:formylglycine-generating enzyme required for sulfatase activity
LLALAPAPTFGDTPKTAGSALEMIKIPGGELTMGTDDRDYSHSWPAHKVTVASFELDKNLVTVAAYQACVDAKACQVFDPKATHFRGQIAQCNGGHEGKGKMPMNCVDLADAKAFCAWAGKRLPTEEEWEYAARGTEGRKYPWGKDEPTAKTRACWNRNTEKKIMGTCEVGSFPDGNTPLGVQDMAGNVGEWTSSQWTNDYLQRDHKNDLSGSIGYAIRGGSWKMDAPGPLTSFARTWGLEDKRDVDLGFRCAR